MAAPLDIDCLSCRATARCACRKGDGTPTEPHAVRVALSVACDVVTCKARVGQICTGAPRTALYHVERMYKAKGITGPAFKVGLQRHIEALVTFLQSCPTEVASAHISVDVRGKANLPRLFGVEGKSIVIFHQGEVYASVTAAEPERRTPPRRPDPRPPRATGLHRVEVRPRRAPESYEDIAEEMEDQGDPDDEDDDEDDDARVLPPGPPPPAPLQLGPSSLAAPVPAPLLLGPSPLAAPQPLALPPPGQQPLLFLLPGGGK